MLENYSIDMFKIPLLHLNVEDWENKKPILMDMMIKSPDYHTQINDVDAGKNNTLLEVLLKQELNSFVSYFNFKAYKVVMSWFQTSGLGDYHGVHNHGCLGYTAVCYLDYDPELHSPTQFVAPFNNFITGESIHYAPRVDEGSIIFVPAAVLHYTNPNKSDKNRSILSLNIAVTYD